MDRNSIIGLTLIGALLVGYTFMSQPSEAEKKKAQQELAKKDKTEIEEKAKDAKTKNIAASNKEKSSDKKEQDSTVVKSESFKPEFLSLKSDKMEVVLSTEGGNVSSVKLNDFLTYRDKFPSDSMKKKKKDVSGMYLFKEGDNKNQLRFTINGKKYSTGNKEFKIASKSDKKVQSISFIL
jgi:YidC/Oxa1 family membrane protein insertase